MKINKFYPYFVIINLLMLFVSCAADPPTAGRSFLIAMILLSSVFGIYCKGWRRFFAIGFVILEIFMCFREVQLEQTLDEHMERIKKAAENYVKTNTPAASSETNANK
jgi:hypothetical protein